MMELVVPEQHLDKENPSHEEEDNLTLKVSLMTINWHHVSSAQNRDLLSKHSQPLPDSRERSLCPLTAPCFVNVLCS